MQRALIRNGQKQYTEALTDFQAAFAARDGWEGDAYLGAVEAALGLEQRETALGYFEKARAGGAAQEQIARTVRSRGSRLARDPAGMEVLGRVASV
ncbi:hypothetical protein ACU4GD_18835 [Cupriavidus basilensis]